ncbi:MAG: GTPase Era [Proteobacteria bacterium]|nr:MAG: GTPase Era [Pseudomonadota bacterium]
MIEPTSRCGTIAIVGRPNVGKSTLLNRIVGQKISITSRKPQTTWYQILGVHTNDNAQMIFVDTPGWQYRPQRQLNRLMNRQIEAALTGVDIVMLVVDARNWHTDDDKVVALFATNPCTKILAMNKHDKVVDKTRMLPLIAKIQAHNQFAEIVPTNALRGDNIDTLLGIIRAALPRAPHRYRDDQITSHSERFLVAELIREKLIRGLGDELPYAASVVIESFHDTGKHIEINAIIWVEREGQKGIVIGAKGARLKSIASAARKDIESLLQRSVFLQTWVKTKSKWADDLNALRELNLSD